jgi:plasmid stability protein
VSNLTLSLDADTLRRARIRALEQGTSVNAVVREFLDAYAAGSATEAKQAVLSLARASTAGSTAGEPARTWTRDDVYAERTLWPRS